MTSSNFVGSVQIECSPIPPRPLPRTSYHIQSEDERGEEDIEEEASLVAKPFGNDPSTSSNRSRTHACLKATPLPVTPILDCKVFCWRRPTILFARILVFPAKGRRGASTVVAELIVGLTLGNN